jgi:3-hydroxyacyl-[acyl-carrier-protein] dehydratase
MAARQLFDIDNIDLERIEFTRDDIRKVNPQRFEFEQLSAIILLRPEEKIIVGLREITGDEFWVPGHMPGRPLFPGVLMLEAAAQLCSFYCCKTMDLNIPYGFGGADRVRFRKIVGIGDRLILLGRCEVATPRRSLFSAQGLVGGQIAFEASILGISLPDSQD